LELSKNEYIVNTMDLKRSNLKAVCSW